MESIASERRSGGGAPENEELLEEDGEGGRAESEDVSSDHRRVRYLLGTTVLRHSGGSSYHRESNWLRGKLRNRPANCWLEGGGENESTAARFHGKNS